MAVTGDAGVDRLLVGWFERRVLLVWVLALLQV